MSTAALAFVERKHRLRIGFRIVFTFVFLVAALLFAFVASTISQPSGDMHARNLLLALSTLNFLIAIAFWVISSRIEITLSQSGIKYVSLYTNKELLWNQISETRYQVTPINYAVHFGLLGLLISAFMKSKPGNLTLRIRSAEGTEIKLNSNLSEAKEAIGLVLGMTVPRMVDTAMAELRQAQTVTFGAIAVSNAELMWKKKAIPFSEISSAKIVGNTLQVKQNDKWLSYISVRSDKIPNVFVFLEVLERLAPQLNTDGIGPLTRLSLAQ